MEDPPGTIARPRELGLVSLAGVALALLMTWPLAAGLGSLGRTRGTDADGQFSIWNIAWVARTLVAIRRTSTTPTSSFRTDYTGLLGGEPPARRHRNPGLLARPGTPGSR